MGEMVSVTAPAYVPFQPRTPEKRALRSHLRKRIMGLRADPGEVLYASFAGALPRRADVENALFYNLDGARVFDAMRHGVSFEVDPTPLPAGVRYEYRVEAAPSVLRHWRPARRVATVDALLGGTTPSLSAIWWALRSTAGAIRTSGEPRGRHEPFMVTLEVAGPGRGLRPGLLKTVLDGTICALQSEADASLAAAMAPLIAARLEAREESVRSALTDHAPSALRRKTRFVHAHGPGIKWEPDDDRCAAARVAFLRASAWRISGSVETARTELPLL